MDIKRALLVNDDTEVFSRTSCTSYGKDRFIFGVVHVDNSDPNLIAKIRGRFYDVIVVHPTTPNTTQDINDALNGTPLVAVVPDEGVLGHLVALPTARSYVLRSHYAEQIVDLLCGILWPEGRVLYK